MVIPSEAGQTLLEGIPPNFEIPFSIFYSAVPVPEAASSSSTIITNPAPLHCQYRSALGRRFCRMAISNMDSGLCSRHAALLQKDFDQADLAASLIGDIQEFRSAADNHSLGELYKL